MAVFQFDLEHGVGQGFLYPSLDGYSVTFGWFGRFPLYRGWGQVFSATSPGVIAVMVFWQKGHPSFSSLALESLVNNTKKDFNITPESEFDHLISRLIEANH